MSSNKLYTKDSFKTAIPLSLLPAPYDTLQGCILQLWSHDHITKRSRLAAGPLRIKPVGGVPLRELPKDEGCSVLRVELLLHPIPPCCVDEVLVVWGCQQKHGPLSKLHHKLHMAHHAAGNDLSTQWPQWTPPHV